MKSGIYIIKSKNSDKRYIGSAKDLTKRISRHKRDLKNGKHHNIHLQRSWNLNGADNFEFNVLVLCDIDELIELEQLAIDELKPEFNILKVAGSSLGFSPSKETREKISKKSKIKGRGLGRKMPPRSEEHCKKLSKSLTGIKRSKYTKEKLSQSRKKMFQERKLNDKNESSLFLS